MNKLLFNVYSFIISGQVVCKTIFVIKKIPDLRVRLNILVCFCFHRYACDCFIRVTTVLEYITPKECGRQYMLE